MKFTFCIIVAFISSHLMSAELSFKSPELQKLHSVVKNIKTIPLFNLDICKVKLGKEVIPSVEQKAQQDEIIAKLKVKVSEKEGVDISNIHSLKELFEYTNFSTFSGVLDNTFCFVNLPQDKLGQHQDRVKLFNAIKEVSDKLKFAVLLDDGLDQGRNVTKLYVYGVDPISNEAYAIKADVE